jgi:hypothetical protein
MVRFANYVAQGIVIGLAALLGSIQALVSLFGSSRLSIRDFYSKKVVTLWVKRSAALLWGTLAYNIFVLAIVEPILRKFFPPLSPWERIKTLWGPQTRYSYADLLPYIGPGIWILGNGLLFALLNRNLGRAREDVEKEAPR